jgi:hypothetical protein
MTGQQGQKRKYNRYGLKRMAELLKGIDKSVSGFYLSF